MNNPVRKVGSAAALALMVATTFSFAATAPTSGKTEAPAAHPYTAKVKLLNRADVDALLAKPEKVVVLDTRRPDELTSKGGFPVYLSIQTDDVEKNLAFIPKDRSIITVSNHAGRAGKVGDLLVSKGYKVAGAVGVAFYEEQGGTLSRIKAPEVKKN
jgi:rhodanese-related sulfurtransferase